MKVIQKIKALVSNPKYYYYRIFDKQYLKERSGERVVFNYLKKIGFFNDIKNKRILEIGPKHGKDSILLASLKPSELVFVEMPSKAERIKEWLPSVASKCPVKIIFKNILYLDKKELEELGSFDLIYCSGVLYHNVEQVRMLKKLYNLLYIDGKIVVESATARNKKFRDMNVVEVWRPRSYRNSETVTHLPSRGAIKIWLEMVGFQNVQIRYEIYSKLMRKNRAVLTARKTKNSKPYYSYLNSNYEVGEAH